MRQAARKGADVMLVPANDWRGFEYSHAENAISRAVENGYTIVRHSTHGISTTVDSQGRVVGSANYFTPERQTMIADVPLQPRTSTVYGTAATFLPGFCLTGTALLVAASLIRRKTASGVRRPRSFPNFIA
jgi:apolipoprotein N-acyltransferase